MVTFAGHDSMSLMDGFLRKAAITGRGPFAKTENSASVQAASSGKCGSDLMLYPKNKKQSAALVAGAKGSKGASR
jgi:hypothetical protein